MPLWNNVTNAKVIFLLKKDLYNCVIFKFYRTLVSTCAVFKGYGWLVKGWEEVFG